MMVSWGLEHSGSLTLSVCPAKLDVERKEPPQLEQNWERSIWLSTTHTTVLTQ